MSDSLWHHEPQHARPPCPSSTPRVHPNSCSLSQWCHATFSSCRPLVFLPSIFLSNRVFSKESALRIRWLKFWSFSFSIIPSNEHPGLISFRMDWLDLLAIQGTLKSLLQHQSSRDSQKSSPTQKIKSINSLALSFLSSPTLTSIRDHCKNHSLD